MDLPIATYDVLKAKGLVQLIKVGDAYAVALTRFDHQTGEKIPPEIQSITLDQVRELLTTMQAQVEKIQMFLSDLEALEGTPGAQ